jgi:hypothetical protein
MRGAVSCVCALLAGCAAVAEAQAANGLGGARSWEAHLRLTLLGFDNFFQAPDGLPEKRVIAAGAGVHVAAPLGRSGPLKAFGHADGVVYRGFGPSGAVTAGLRSQDGPRSYVVALRYVRGRPTREVGDVLDRADFLGLSTEYSHRPTRHVQLTGLADLGREWYDLPTERTNAFFRAGGALRYRGFGSRFSPEAGLLWGRRDVRDDNEDASQRELFVRLRWAPSRPAYLSLGYRRRDRTYTVTDSLASNHGRRDTRHQWTLGASLRQDDRRTWSLYYARESSDSTRPAGVFATQLVGLGLTLRF